MNATTCTPAIATTMILSSRISTGERLRSCMTPRHGLDTRCRWHTSLCCSRSGGECGLVYNGRFQMPAPPGPARVAGGYITRNNANGSYLAPAYDVPEIIPLWCELLCISRPGVGQSMLSSVALLPDCDVAHLLRFRRPEICRYSYNHGPIHFLTYRCSADQRQHKRSSPLHWQCFNLYVAGGGVIANGD